MRLRGLSIVSMLALAMIMWVALPVKQVHAATCTVTTSTNWSALTCGTGGGQPTAADGVFIKNGATLTVNVSDAVAASVQVAGSNPSAGNGTLAFNSGSQLTVSGSVTVGAVQGVTSFVGTIAMTNGGTLIANSFAKTGSAAQVLTSGSGTIELRATNTLLSDFTAYNNLTVNGGTTTLGVATSINGNLTITSGTLSIGASNFGLTVAGNWTNGGTFTQGTGTVTFNGAAAQTIGGTSATTFNNLTINNSSADSAGVTLGIGQTVNGTLTLTDGLLKVASYDLTLGTGASISGGTSITSMVVTDTDGSATGDGFLCKVYPGNGAFTFPVGDAYNTTQYSPSTLNFSSNLTNPSTVCVRVTNARHPSWPGSEYPTYINRYWTTTNTDTAFSCTASFTYVDASSGEDVVIESGQSEAALFHKIWNGSAWTTGNQANTIANQISTNVTSFSDHTAFSGSPTAVTLAGFSAVQQGDAVLLTWETVSELDNRGFNLYRGTSAAGPDRQLNETLIPSQSQGSPGGFIYTWEDRANLVPGATYYYWVEDVSLSGATTLHGPVSVDYSAPTAVTLSGMQAAPTAGTGLAVVAMLLTLLAPLAGALAMRRRRA